jgi:uncharacterized protein YndB with AHSA1/START domain
MDTSTIPGAGPNVRSLVKEVVVATDPMVAWTAWTTSEEIDAWWGPPASNVDLRIGGKFEMLFDIEAEPGSQGGEGCRYLGYVPGEMISFTWNAPPHIALRTSNTWVVITFSEVEAGTHVRLVHTGFLEGGDWDSYMDYFQQAWGFVLDLFADHWS